MSFLDKIFGNNQKSEDSKSFWKKIQSEEDLENAIQESYERKIAIFKHSTSCFISKTVLKNIEKEIEASQEENVSYYFLDLLAYRPLSNKIAIDFGVHHESPQFIVFHNGKAINNASHQHISISQI